METATVMAAILALLEAIILAGVGFMMKQQKAISDLLMAQNGRIGRLETWKDDHNKQDDERHAIITKELDKLDNDRCRA